MDEAGVGIFMVFYLALIVLMFASMWKIYEKAGQPGWAAIVPIYNGIIMLKIVGKPWWWILFMMIPYAGAVWAIWTINLMSLSYGKSTGYTFGILFLSPIFMGVSII